MKKILSTIGLLASALMAQAQFVMTDTTGHVLNIDEARLAPTHDASAWTLAGTDLGAVKTLTRSFPTFGLSIQKDAIYAYGTKSDAWDGSANYYLALSSVEVEYSEDGQMLPTGTGAVMFLDLFAPACEDPNQALLPEGLYTINDTWCSMTCENTYTFARVRNRRTGEGYENKIAESGTVSVSHRGVNDEGWGQYHIDVDYVCIDGERIRATYDGSLEFRNLGGGHNDEDRRDTEIVTDVNTTFVGMAVTCHGGDADYHRYTLQLFDGTDREDGLIVDGVVLNIDLFGVAEPELCLTPGHYEASLPYEQVEEFEPWQFLPGACYQLMGYPLVIGTYAQDLREVPEGGDLRYGYVLTGSVDIIREGEKYGLTADLTTDLGTHIVGTLPLSEVRFIDSRPVVPLGPWESYLTEDHEIVYSNDTYAYAHCYANYPVEGCDEFEVIVNDHITGESFQLDLITPAGQMTPAGTYTVGNEGEYQPGTFIAGYRNFAVLGGTWPWMYYEGDDAEPTLIAPATDGIIQITEQEDGTFVIEFSLQDDAEPRHTISTRWQGVINDTWHTWH